MDMDILLPPHHSIEYQSGSVNGVTNTFCIWFTKNYNLISFSEQSDNPVWSCCFFMFLFPQLWVQFPCSPSTYKSTIYVRGLIMNSNSVLTGIEILMLFVGDLRASHCGHNEGVALVLGQQGQTWFKF